MHDHEKRAARTTIVGGQPPGNARELPPVPVGLEQLLGLAAASAAFAEALVRERVRAAEAAGVTLSAAEAAILAAVPDASLGQMIARVDTALPQPERRHFLERAAAAAALLVGGTVLSGCGEKKPESPRQASPPPPPPRPDAGFDPGRMKPTGIRPDRVPHPPAGIRPDPPTAGVRPDPPPPRPQKIEVSAGVRQPDPPDAGAADPPDQTPIGGVRPTRSRPEHRGTKTGISPSRD